MSDGDEKGIEDEKGHVEISETLRALVLGVSRIRLVVDVPLMEVESMAADLVKERGS